MNGYISEGGRAGATAAGGAGLLLALGVLLAGCQTAAQNGPLFIGTVFDWTQFVIAPKLPTVNSSRKGYVLLGDFTNDGKLDAASGFASSNAIILSIQNSPASWINRVIVQARGGINSLDSADVDQSGQADLVAATDAGELLLALAPAFAVEGGTWQVFTLANPQFVSEWHDVKLAHLSGQPQLEIVAISRTDNVIGYWQADGVPKSGDAYQTTVIAHLVPGGYERLATADLDGDQNIDVIAVGPTAGIIWLQNQGTSDLGRTWLAHKVTNRTGLTRVVAADVDGDGRPDLVATDHDTGQIIWYENLGFARTDVWPEHIITDLSPGRPDAISAADIIDSGRLSLFVGTDAPQGGLFWMTPYSNVRQPWSVQKIIETGFDVGELPSGDIDGTGGTDFATTLAGSDTPIVWFKQQ